MRRLGGLLHRVFCEALGCPDGPPSPGVATPDLGFEALALAAGDMEAAKVSTLFTDMFRIAQTRVRAMRTSATSP